MRSASYGFSNSTYSSQHGSYKSSGPSKIPTPSFRPTISLFPTPSSTSKTLDRFNQSPSVSDFRSNSYSKEYPSSKTRSSFSSGAGTVGQPYQKRSSSFSAESSASNAASVGSSRHSPPRFSPSSSRTEITRSLSLQRQNSSNQEGGPREDTSRFASSQRWSTKERSPVSRSTSMDSSYSRRQQDGSSLRSSAADSATNFTDKRKSSLQYPYAENKSENSPYNFSYPYSTESSSPSYESPTLRTDFRAREEPQSDAIDQQAFFQRLARAHSVVDDLLKSRGLKYDEEPEPKYYRHWEPVEIIQEETVPSPARRSSSASDSGLSLDNDSDRSSNFEVATPGPSSSPAPVFREESAFCEATFVKSPQSEYVFLVRLWALCTQVALTAVVTIKKPPDKPKPERIEEQFFVEEAVVGMLAKIEKVPGTKHSAKKLPMPKKKPKIEEPVSVPPRRELKKVSPFPATQKQRSKVTGPIVVLRKTESKPKDPVKSFPKLQVKLKELTPAPPKEVHKMKKPAPPEPEEESIRKGSGPTFQVQMPQQEQRQQQKRKPERKLSSQLLTLARCFRRKNLFGRSSAEISIQHVSFYQVAQSLIEQQKPVEKSVRIHLRLTERAPTSSQVTIVLFLKSRVLRVSSEWFPPARGSRGSKIPKLRKTIPAHARKPEAINPIRIPENFLKVLNPTAKTNKEKDPDQPNEIRIVRGNLKRVPFNRTISGPSLAVCMARNQQYEFSKNEQCFTTARCSLIKSNATRTGFTKPERSCENRPIARETREKRTVKPVTTSRVEAARPAPKTHADQKNFFRSRRRVVTPAGGTDAFKLKVSEIATFIKDSCQSYTCEYERRQVIPGSHAILAFAQAHFSSLNCKQKKILRICNKNGSKAFKSVSHGDECEVIQESRNGKENTAPKENISKPSVPRGSNVTLEALETVVLKSCKNMVKEPIPTASPLLPTLRPTEQPSAPGAHASRNPFNVQLRSVNRHKCRSKQEFKAIRSASLPPISKRSEDEVEDEEDDKGKKRLSKDDDEAKRRPSIYLEREESLNEAEQAMLAARKRQEEEQVAKLLDYEEHRRIEREKEEEELRALKEKQERRRMEREREEKEFAIKLQHDEERRKHEEDERKAKLEADRRKKEEEKKKRALLTAATFTAVSGGHSGGRNFVITTKTDRADKFGNIVQAKQEMGMTKEQQEEAKRTYLAATARTIDIQATDIAMLKEKIRVLHQKICRLEADKYDLEKRQERQEYDLRELNERQRQVARNKALKKGIDPADSASSKYPPKVSIVSKYDRQFDRRNFFERRAMFENKRAYPCFPNVPPPPAVYEKVIRSMDNIDNEEGDEEEIEDYDDEDEE